MKKSININFFIFWWCLFILSGVVAAQLHLLFQAGVLQNGTVHVAALLYFEMEMVVRFSSYRMRDHVVARYATAYTPTLETSLQPLLQEVHASFTHCLLEQCDCDCIYSYILLILRCALLSESTWRFCFGTCLPQVMI